ncbi:MAG: serine acetyltransferase [Acutalibacteraceae bacterium]|nr:serine acetyltransferase [Acutalibacteraceae bacterium]
MKEVIKSDYYRYFGDSISLKNRLFPPIELKYTVVMRKAQLASNIFTKLFYKLKLKHLKKITLIDISPETKIGKGLYLGHNGTRIINPNCVIGDNVNIATGVTIGQTNRGDKKGTPTIGNKVWIGTNAVIVGNISIGDNVLIAPNTYVNFDVPDNSIVIGSSKASIHNNENATKDYINRTV